MPERGKEVIWQHSPHQPEGLEPRVLVELSRASENLGKEFNRQVITLQPSIETNRRVQAEKLNRIISSLDSNDFKEWISHGYITCAMFKPELYDQADASKTDEDMSRILRQRIHAAGLSILLEASFFLDEEMLEGFYDDAKVAMGEERWSQFSKQMLSKPVTFLILYDPKGKADKNWREVIGATDPKQAKKGSIRADFAESLEKGNLVHGSSMKETGAVRREVGIFVDFLERYSKN